ncbi:MAG: hypothetical protein KKA84_07650 [Bacteroidetes bacterium]|nr:hypothetical protein [Bacteroidota bacterium]
MNKTILLDDFEEGMELAVPLKNKFGQVLLGANVKLEKKHKNLFRTWGIETLVIVSDDEGEEPIDESLMAEAETILAKKIYWTPKNKFEENLIQMGMDNILDKLR